MDILSRINKYISLYEEVDPVIISWNAICAKYYNDLDKFLRSNGFKPGDKSKSSALYENEYTKDDLRISVSGWHGSGRYTGTKTIFNILAYTSLSVGSDTEEFNILSVNDFGKGNLPIGNLEPKFKKNMENAKKGLLKWMKERS